MLKMSTYVVYMFTSSSPPKFHIISSWEAFYKLVDRKIKYAPPGRDIYPIAMFSDRPNARVCKQYLDHERGRLLRVGDVEKVVA